MARSTRDGRLETRSARTKLSTQHEPYWRSIGQNLSLGYRKGKVGSQWIARIRSDGAYIKRVIGKADDFQDANDIDVFSYHQAQAQARMFAEGHAKRLAGLVAGPYTVAQAMADYLAWYQAHRKSHASVRHTIHAHILPTFGNKLLSDLTTQTLRKWHQTLATTPPKGQQVITDQRARQATANRILTVFKAALNHAWREGKAPSDDAWRRVKPFRNVESPRVRSITEAECSRLINACPEDLRQLVTAALLTGCRYGELIILCGNDFNPDVGTVYIRDSKSGKPRYVPLTDEGIGFFTRLTAGRSGSERLLIRQDGEAWGKSHAQRPLREACHQAGIDPPISFHILRHTYASTLAMRGVPLQVIAAALGHSDTRITERHYAHLMPSFVADTIRANLPAFGVELDNVVVVK